MEGQGHIRSVYEVGVITALFAIVSAALGRICGLSGGGLLVPPYMVVLGLSPKFAIPLTKVTIVGVAGDLLVESSGANTRTHHTDR
ncbi:hypothetical protein H257_11848 [Aphanomyces astaci]|uniref:Uncharacterized protein n=1 Tax=Aphanomyces astaci TaxID=112090 RepID=W4G0U1_APHAT|nr:hypothetical protein H257_11848 [Aphanomyces astaci]ETV73327.1 hypothetical protein H257_11848 [Aphanomyces astaci]|eukprot:XP_009837202.1 hypothetical protein H257_11848 [Aphanomyces astaci]